MEDDQLYDALIVKLEDDADAAVEGFCQSTGLDKDHVAARMHRYSVLWNLVAGAEEALELADVHPRTRKRLWDYGQNRVQRALLNLYPLAVAAGGNAGSAS